MKAIVYKKFGTPENLQLTEVKKPVPGENEVLVKVHAASINSWDWDKLRGRPKVYRFLFGWFSPKHKILGADIAGTVETVGKKVSQFKAGDEVFGDLCASGWGGFAEYVCAKENALTEKPKELSFEEAASLSQAGNLAWQGLYDKKPIQPGQNILINGAGGGSGVIALQIARMVGAKITGVDRAVKHDRMKKLGAENTIDYEEQNYTLLGEKYDLILDVMGFYNPKDYTRVLKPGGTYAMVGGSPSSIIKVTFANRKIAKKTGKRLGLVMHVPNKDNKQLASLCVSGKIRPVIDSVFPLEETREAFQYFAKNEFVGKIVIKVR